VGTDLSLFDWMNEQVPPDHTDWRRSRAHETTRGPLPDTTTQRGLTTGSEEGSSSNSGGSTAGMMVARPEKLLFHQAMAGLDRGQEHFYLRDYPWQDLGAGTVVDVGGGIGKAATCFCSSSLMFLTDNNQKGSCFYMHVF
jgi:hypothetical protein